MNWKKTNESEPPRENEFDVYTNCMCAIANKLVITDAVYYHAEHKYFHNQDTSHSNPIPATHWHETLQPPKN